MSTGKPRKSADPLYLLLREGNIDDFNRRHKAGESCDLRGCDFRGIDLRGVDVARAAWALRRSAATFSNGLERQKPPGRRVMLSGRLSGPMSIAPGDEFAV
jgi:hypothetical protein